MRRRVWTLLLLLLVCGCKSEKPTPGPAQVAKPPARPVQLLIVDLF